MSAAGSAALGAHDEEEHEEHVNHEAWVIPYADMLTLLMVMFVALFAVSNVDKAKFQELAASAQAAFGGGSIAGSGESLLSGAGIGQLNGLRPADLAQSQLANAALAAQQFAESARAAEQQALEDVQATITGNLDQSMRDAIGFRFEERGLIVTIVTDAVLFPSGSAAVQPAGADVLRAVAGAVHGLPNQIAVEGHTDPTPISTAQFPSNWELSTARASSVLRFLVDDAGLDPSRLTASGYADTRPIADNAAAEGRDRNRRVEIVVLSSQPAGGADAGGAVEGSSGTGR